MRHARVVTNLTCDQRCAPCVERAPSDAPAFVQPRAVRARIRDALSLGASELTLTGGEPGLRRDLASLVAFARSLGAERVTLETNATTLDDARALALRDSGLTLARVNLSGWGPALDAFTHDPGGFDRSLRGLHALLSAGLPVELSGVLVRPTLALLPALPEALSRWCAERFPRGSSLRGGVVTVPSRAPDPALLLSPPEAALALEALDHAARRASFPLRLAPGSGPPPCAFPSPLHAARLYALTRGDARRPGWSHAPACEACVARDRCPGAPDETLARFGDGGLRALADDRVRRRLTLIDSVEHQQARELVSRNRWVDPEHGPVEEDVIRVDFRCNQACRFCFVSTHLPPPDLETVREAILSAARAGRRVTLSGGEPTLRPELTSLVALARAHSGLPIQLQTNATRLDEAAVRALVDAGMTEAFVSLHAHSEALSDALTGAPGTWARTHSGLDHLHRAGVKLTLNYVLCAPNLGELPEHVRRVASRWPGAGLNVSFVAPSSDLVPRDPEFIPRYSDVLPHLTEAVAEALRLGAALSGFESRCGLPLCLAPGAPERFLSLPALLPDEDRGEFLKPPPCSGCALASRCHGLRRGYAALHGWRELRPVTG